MREWEVRNEIELKLSNMICVKSMRTGYNIE